MAKLKIGKAVTEVSDIKIDGVEAKTVSVGTEEVTGAPEAKSITVGDTTYGISAGGSGSNPARVVTADLYEEDDDIIIHFETDGVDIFNSMVIVNETKHWNITLVSGDISRETSGGAHYLAGYGVEIQSGVRTYGEGFSINVEDDGCYVNEGENNTHFWASSFTTKIGGGFATELSDVVKLYYTHTDFSIIIAD